MRVHITISTNTYMYNTAVVYTKGIHALTLCTNKATQWGYQHYLKSTYKGTCTRHVWVDVRKPVYKHVSKNARVQCSVL